MTAIEAPPAAPAATFLGTQAREALCVWECACDAWTDYFAALAASPTPTAVIEANARLALGLLDAYERAAGTMLADSGVKAPLLSDA